MSFPGASVELLRNRIAAGLGQIVHTTAFRQILPDQSVGVFVSPPLPRMIGVCEVEADIAAIFEIAVSMEFATVVRRDRFEAIRVFRDKMPEPFIGRLRVIQRGQVSDTAGTGQ